MDHRKGKPVMQSGIFFVPCAFPSPHTLYQSIKAVEFLYSIPTGGPIFYLTQSVTFVFELHTDDGFLSSDFKNEILKKIFFNLLLRVATNSVDADP